MSEQDQDKEQGQDKAQDSGATDEAGETEKGNPIKEMFLLALLYLPLGFFLWFFFGSALMFPTARLSDLLLTGFFPDIFEQLLQLGFQLEIHTRVVLPEQVDGQTAAVNIHVNPMIYAWGMALLFGLIMATPLTMRQRLLQLLIAFVVVTLVTVWGVFWETWVDLAFRSGPEAGQAAREAIFPMDMIALCYQLGYLMFPAVVPVAAWILMNRPFIEQYVLRRRH
ncbi:hypothetical protein IC757_02455 [Wenzhouxiangella sp. AB-CW3]|uniref:exosortase H-associated membrane protein n=1 Tax=Wenzhouxiangella sp. AB-CW3 TaxID=2771012 RepID=UPI00168A504E|nr:exosortase H-associated membrane protein [Wenzhouxiangella sp. AB-CW3]QOC23040.1 hypothetical protein IC757_02455 [Wenzhouxiangella sp. AB-CW3]